jgi:integrase
VSSAADSLRQLRVREGRDTGPVFATRDGCQLDAANVRREFRAAVKAAGIGGTWTPRELRHTFVSAARPFACAGHPQRLHACDA